MPELPEVETTRRGLERLAGGCTVERVLVHEARLRWPVPRRLPTALAGARIDAVRRRAKYLLLDTARGTALVHLGMSGSLSVLPEPLPAGPHDRVDFVLEGGRTVRLRDPRRFGAVLWCTGDPLAHPLLASLGPEPLEAGFDGAALHRCARGRRLAVKSFIMDSRVVAGVGNIYAAEALHRSGVHPRRAAGRISRARYDRLAADIRAVLTEAIHAGGTTLRDFVGSAGELGEFVTRLRVYGRAGKPCGRCGAPLKQQAIGQRSSAYCPRCQR